MGFYFITSINSCVGPQGWTLGDPDLKPGLVGGVIALKWPWWAFWLFNKTSCCFSIFIRILVSKPFWMPLKTSSNERWHPSWGSIILQRAGWLVTTFVPSRQGWEWLGCAPSRRKSPFSTAEVQMHVCIGPWGLWKKSGLIYLRYDHYAPGLFSQ